MAEPAKRPATYADLEAVPEHLVAEIIDGELVTHSHGQWRLSMLRTALSFQLHQAFPLQSWRNTGWLILHLPELHLGSQVIVPDICGWRAERVPVLPESHFDYAPDWICEILSDETVRYDRGRKREIYAELGVSDLWLVDPRARLLETFTLGGGRYCWTQTCGEAGDVTASPFDAKSFPMSALWPLGTATDTSKNH
jgi:Uma2 family endonuclease